MKKLFKILSVTLFAFVVTACGDKADPAAEFKKLNDWSVNNQQAVMTLQTEIQQSLASQDQAKIEEAVKKFNDKFAEFQKELDAIEVKDPEIKAFKDKVKNGLVSSNKLITDVITLMKSPTAELQKQVQEETQKVMQEAMEVTKLQAELQKKYPVK
jgi:lipoprotein hlpB